MGYDLTARNGSYFRANVWTWPAIQAVVASTMAVDRALEMGEDVLAEEATKIAIELERILPDLEERTDAKVPTHLGTLVDLLKAEVGSPVCGIGSRGEPQTSSYVYKEKLAEFAEFCRHSGGFYIG